MQQELPTSQCESISPKTNLISTQTGTSKVSDLNTIVIPKSAVLSSVCETVLSSSASTTHTPKPSATISLVISNNEKNTSVTVAHLGPTTTTTMARNEYKLTEIVSLEKDILFKTESDPDVELEPARENVFSVRRRSRQFFTVMEEDENDTDGKESQSEIVDAAKTEERKVVVEPLFNLGDSLRQLYFPNQHKKRKPKKKRELAIKNHLSQRHGYESDPEGKYDLHKIIRDDPEFNHYTSQPELSVSDGQMPALEDSLFEARKAKSLPTTPRISPKLKRRNSLKNEKNQNELQKTGPGFSFLESVAGQLHLKKLQQDKKHEQGLVRMAEKQVVSSKPVEVIEVVNSPTDKVVSYSEPATSMHTHHLHDFSDSAGSDLEAHKPNFMKSFFTWSTTQKVKVNNKESNMFSPSSF